MLVSRFHGRSIRELIVFMLLVQEPINVRASIGERTFTSFSWTQEPSKTCRFLTPWLSSSGSYTLRRLCLIRPAHFWR